MRTSSVGLTGTVGVAQSENRLAKSRPAGSPPSSAAHSARHEGAQKTQDPIVIVSVHLLSRECLARVLGAECKLPVVCFSTIDEWLAADLPARPSLVVVCQWARSKADSLKEVERLSEISDRTGHCPAIILSDNEDPDLIVQMLGKNVRGYVPTSLSIGVAIQAMELARAGGVFVPASSLIAAHRGADNESTTLQKANGLFTARQAAVVDALRRGKANKIIAYELKMRESTVKVHVRNIMKKLRATNRTEVAYLTNRLLSGDEPAS